MTTRIICAAIAALSICSAFAQAKKPIIMVVPADVWMNTNGFTRTVDNQGTPELVMEYERAIQTNSDLNMAISKLGELMTERGFPLQDLGQVIKDMKAEAAENLVMDNSESMLDQLSRQAKCDVVMKLDYSVENGMKGRQLKFNLQGFDSYTNKQIAAASGVGQPSSAILAELVSEAVIAHLDKFNAQLQTHFDDLFANGREITVRVKSASGCVQLDEEFNGEELRDLIEKWCADNAVQNRIGSPTGDAQMTIPQVRIPLYGADGRAIDARGWANGLAKYIKETTGQTSKRIPKGLGTTTLIICGK
ncbi:MAG: hypothetical protein IPN62_02580 [Flavobacteriales bacterium]|nr:hypothetical protein [Flavobacteriales bacterium]